MLIVRYSDMFINHITYIVVLSMGPNNRPGVQVRTAKTIQFGSNLVQRPDTLYPGVPNLVPDP
jgi:hypothetical protein